MIHDILMIIALLLGLHYFLARKVFDSENIRNAQRRTICETILDVINRYDEKISDILDARFQNSAQLEELRDKANRDFDLVYAYLESCAPFFKNDGNDFSALYKLHSFVDNNNIIMYRPYDDLKILRDSDGELISEKKEEYKDLLKFARITCLKNAINSNPPSFFHLSR